MDDIAGRIAALGGSPAGTPGALVAQRNWDDYAMRRAAEVLSAFIPVIGYDLPA